MEPSSILTLCYEPPDNVSSKEDHMFGKSNLNKK